MLFLPTPQVMQSYLMSPPTSTNWQYDNINNGVKPLDPPVNQYNGYNSTYPQPNHINKIFRQQVCNLN